MGTRTTDDGLEQPSHHKKRLRTNSLLPIGALMTAGVLTVGLISFKQGNSHLGQELMRGRIVFQGLTVALMLGTAFYYADRFRKQH